MSQLHVLGGTLVRRVGKAAKTSLAVIGFGTVAGLGYYYNDRRKFLASEVGNKQRVLVLPFDRFKIVQTRNPLKLLSQQQQQEQEQVVTAQELVHVIQQATEDPHIVAIYGHFGGAERSFTGGPAVAEEVRNALKVFRESHRVHPEPNVHHTNSNNPEMQRRQPRPLFAYAVSYFHTMLFASWTAALADFHPFFIHCCFLLPGHF
jgi:hypothetical protein